MKRLRWRIAQFFEIRWWNNYLKKKNPADYLAWKQAYWRQLLQNSGVQMQEGQKILDAGCGPAGIFTVLDHFHPDAVDPLLDQYEQTLPHFSKAQWPGTRFYNASIESYQPDQLYDIIFCLNAINHVEHLQVSLDRLSHWLRPGGTLAISIDAHNHQWIKHILRLIPGDILHPHQFDLEEYKGMLTSRGFDVKTSILVKKEAIFNYWLIIAMR